MCVFGGGGVNILSSYCEIGHHHNVNLNKDNNRPPSLGWHPAEAVCGYMLTKHLITVDPKASRGVIFVWCLVCHICDTLYIKK